MTRANLVVAVTLLLTCSGGVSAQTTIETDGDVKAQGFIGDGSLVTDVDAQLLDGMDSSAFAQETDLQSAEAMLVALQARVADLRRCLSRAQRFLDQGDGTVLDCSARLTWLKDASCADLAGTDGEGRGDWATAQSAAAALTSGTCGLTDGSTAGDWRQPTVQEWCSAWAGSALRCPASAAPTSMIDSAAGPPTIPTPHPFVGVQAGSPVDLSAYWSATGGVSIGVSIGAWGVFLASGEVYLIDDKAALHVWPVRGGQ